MIEMRGADAYFLWEESRTRHMHTMKIVVVDPSTAKGDLTFARVRSDAAAVMARMPAFRRKPVRVPLGFGHPFWLDAPDLDLAHHFRHVVLPPCPPPDALDRLVGRIASEPLDPSHPLWELHFVERLPGGLVAFVIKIHHAVADGLASARLLAETFRPGIGALPPPTGGPLRNEEPPRAARRLGEALLRQLARQRELPGLVLQSLRAMALGQRWRREGRPQPVRPFRGPMTRFNRPLTGHRVFTHVTLPLEALRAIRARTGSSINDIYLSLCGGALRRYLHDHGELPDRALTATVPMSVRQPGEDPSFGNATVPFSATTGSDIADPAERLRVVTESTRAARALFEARGDARWVTWYDHWLVRGLYVARFPVLVSALLGVPSFNVIVSNVRGPSEPLVGDGARVVALYSMGPLARQQGLNFTAWSYCGDFTVGLQACREHVPDLPKLAEGLALELEELGKAVGPPHSDALA